MSEDHSFKKYLTVREFADLWGISISTVHRWIKAKNINFKSQNRRYLIDIDDYQKNYPGEYFQYRERYRNKYFYVPYVPDELNDYIKWHEVIDYLSWLLKVCYSSPDQIKKKNFRIDNIFQNYFRLNNLELNKIGKIFSPSDEEHKNIIDDLKRGWYNELSYIYPLKSTTLSLSYSDIQINSEISNERFTFPSIKIISFYYSIYFYLRAVTLMKYPKFRKEEHKSTINCFKNNLFEPFKKSIWKFPLDLAWIPNKRLYRREMFINQLNHIKYAYSKHPRTPNYTPPEIIEILYGLFKREGKKYKNKTAYTIFDFFLEFRIWANYQDIDNLLSLWGIGYKSFLDQNLSLLLFLIAGISELCVIAVYGEEKYINELQSLYNLFASNNEIIRKSFKITAPYQRYMIYKNKLHIIDMELTIIEEPNVNEIS